MNSKLTLKLDRNVIASAKQYAMMHNTSLSKLIENYLQAITSSQSREDIKISPLVKSLTGVIEHEEKDYKKKYTAYLSEKYR